MSVTNTNRWKLGLFVTVGIAVSIGSLMWLGISQLQRRTTPAYFYFMESVNGLEVGSPVKFLGVEVGRVDDIFPAPDRRHIEVRAGIYVDTLEAWGISPSEYENRAADQSFVSEDIRGQLKSSALTGVAFIQLGIFDVEKKPIPSYNFPIPWETIHTVPSTFKSLERGLMEALEEWPGLAKRAEGILGSINRGLEQLDFAKLNEEAIAVLGGLDELMHGLQTSPIVDSSSPTIVKLDRTLDEFHGLLTELRGRDGEVRKFVESVSGAAEAVREDFSGADVPGALAAVEGAGRGLETTSEEMTLLMAELRTSLAQADAALRSVQQLAELLARDPGALLHGRSPQAPFLDR